MTYSQNCIRMCFLVWPFEMERFHHMSLPDDEKLTYPLPEDHWINQPLENENCVTLLQLSVGQAKPEFTRLLIRSGARADQYNDMLDTAVIHTAILEGHGEQHLVALFDDSRYEITN